MATEKELLVKLEVVEKEIKGVRNRINELRLELWNKESDLLTAQLLKEKLMLDLKEAEYMAAEPENKRRDEDIERFRKVLPELMEKEKNKEEK